jgi:hypothetical protein
MNVTLLYFDDCPNWRSADVTLTRLAGQYGFEFTRQRVRSVEEAERLGFRGSPSVIVDGIDPFADPEAPVGLSCRLYRGPNGLTGAPTEEMLHDVFATRAGDVPVEGRARLPDMTLRRPSTRVVPLAIGSA